MMDSLLQSEAHDQKPPTLAKQAAWYCLHAMLALGSWIALMLVGYAVDPAGVSQWAILLLSMAVPLAVGFAVTKVRADDTATVVWLLGAIWALLFSLYVLDLPTGPGRCFQCDATEKLTRTFFSLPSPSGLIDDDGPFLGTWPSAALVGYSIGARLALRRKS